jgi:hypothetical protein
VTKKPAAVQPDLGEKTELLAILDTCVEKLIAAALAIPLEALKAPPANPSPFAKNYGEALHFGALHFAIHSGQLSTIRRSLGKPPLV